MSVCHIVGVTSFTIWVMACDHADVIAGIASLAGAARRETNGDQRNRSGTHQGRISRHTAGPPRLDGLGRRSSSRWSKPTET